VTRSPFRLVIATYSVPCKFWVFFATHGVKNIRIFHKDSILNLYIMFPIYYNGKKYYEEDCDEVFLAFYEPAAMTPFGVYMSEGVWITPDGKCHHD